MIPDVAIGAIAAALIGAIISLVGLIVSKESKVSEFRQSWIDSLRSELSTFLASANSIASAREIEYRNNKERLETLRPIYERLNETYYSIALRLNPTETESKNLRGCIVRISNYVNSGQQSDFSKFDSDRTDFINLSNIVLKREWKRVKRGEPVYKVARWIATSATLFLIAIASYLVFHSPRQPRPDTTISTGIPAPKQKLNIAQPGPKPVSDKEKAAATTPK
ncbi:hypothetical protein [Sphingopyxis sp. 550A]